MKKVALSVAALGALLITACEHPQHLHPTLVCIRANESAVGYPYPNDQNYHITNQAGSSASGAYQILDGTWRQFLREMGRAGEYSRAKDAPEYYQDMVAEWAIIDPGKYKHHWTGKNRRCY